MTMQGSLIFINFLDVYSVMELLDHVVVLPKALTFRCILKHIPKHNYKDEIQIKRRNFIQYRSRIKIGSVFLRLATRVIVLVTGTKLLVQQEAQSSSSELVW